MVIINLPVNQYLISVSAELILESYILDKFYPFAFYSFEINKDSCYLNIIFKGNSLEVSCGKKRKMFSVSSLQDAYRKIIYVIREHIIFCKDSIALHASTVDFGVKRYVFLAETGTGKSTLASYLNLKRDVFCRSDDIVYINYMKQASIASSKNIYLRESARNINELSNILFNNYDMFLSRYLVSVENNIDITERKIDKIILLSRENINECYLSKCDDPFNALLGNLFFTHQIKESLRAVLHLIETIPVDVLHYNQLSQVYDYLKKEIDDSF